MGSRNTKGGFKMTFIDPKTFSDDDLSPLRPYYIRRGEDGYN